MEFSRNEDDELRSPGIMARSIPAGMPKVDMAVVWGAKFRARRRKLVVRAIKSGM